MFWGRYCSFCIHFRAFCILENRLIGNADDSTLMAVMPSPGLRVTVAESLIRDLGRVSECTERIACILSMHLGECRFFTHPTALMYLKK